MNEWHIECSTHRQQLVHFHMLILFLCNNFVSVRFLIQKLTQIHNKNL